MNVLIMSRRNSQQGCYMRECSLHHANNLLKIDVFIFHNTILQKSLKVLHPFDTYNKAGDIDMLWDIHLGSNLLAWFN